MLRGPAEGPLIRGREVERVTQVQFEILKTLIDAGERGLSLPELKRFSGHETAEKTLKRLAQSSEIWKQIILLPGAPGRRYRLLFE